MGEKPILFAAPMVRAILEGRKTQTRRIFKGVEPMGDGTWHVFGSDGGSVLVHTADIPSVAVDYVRWTVGDVLWVREAWKPIPESRPGGYFVPGSHFYGREFYYRADDDCPIWANGPWKPSIHMPRAASRISLKVTDVKVERLQDISVEDAVAEGVFVPEAQYAQQGPRAPILAYAGLWCDINGPGSWEANPWVSATTFERIGRASE